MTILGSAIGDVRVLEVRGRLDDARGRRAEVRSAPVRRAVSIGVDADDEAWAGEHAGARAADERVEIRVEEEPVALGGELALGDDLRPAARMLDDREEIARPRGE